jgi:uncharacterized membrane protein (GlpM family)
MQFVIRFLVGGTIVLLFAALGDVLEPKSFAGLFGAAPSVALATLTLTIFADGKHYAAVEARSMIAGAIGFLAYTFLSCQLMMRGRVRGAYAAIAMIVAWFAVSFGIWTAALK